MTRCPPTPREKIREKAPELKLKSRQGLRQESLFIPLRNDRSFTNPPTGAASLRHACAAARYTTVRFRPLVNYTEI